MAKGLAIVPPSPGGPFPGPGLRHALCRATVPDLGPWPRVMPERLGTFLAIGHDIIQQQCCPELLKRRIRRARISCGLPQGPRGAPAEVAPR